MKLLWNYFYYIMKLFFLYNIMKLLWWNYYYEIIIMKLFCSQVRFFLLIILNKYCAINPICTLTNLIENWWNFLLGSSRKCFGTRRWAWPLGTRTFSSSFSPGVPLRWLLLASCSWCTFFISFLFILLFFFFCFILLFFDLFLIFLILFFYFFLVFLTIISQYCFGFFWYVSLH